MLKSDKCPVCEIFVARYPEWLAQIEFSDHTTAVFDEPKDMYRDTMMIRKKRAAKNGMKKTMHSN